MRDADSPYNKVSSDVIFKKVSDDLVQIIINDNRISSFHIIHDWYANDVIESNDNFVNSLVAISPNPITAESDNAKITFEVKKSGNVYIELFDVLGNKVADITDAYYNAGRYDINFNLRDIKGSKLSSGSYTVRMTTGMDVQRFNLIVLQ
ncbi:hypothetical protein SDC9_155926 [bioreactor metagenome]|uniref:Uncharacterized protein n=1 Tax=bioreactor metagenome TaxID=1076179 RepID=A0A645F310_9ZZZZ